jgi:hypothetical protein
MTAATHASSDRARTRGVHDANRNLTSIQMPMRLE